MMKRRNVFAILIALALLANIPSVSAAEQNMQSSQPPAVQNYTTGQPGQDGSRPLPQPAAINQNQSGLGSGQTPQPN